MKSSLLVLLMALSLSFTAQANWTWNIGYQNPPGALVGVNLMYLGTQWAFEAGVGSITNSDNSTSVGGDLNLKYLFGTGWFRPYLEAGVGLSTGAKTGDNAGVSAGTGGGFVGGGLLLKGNPFYVYLGAVSANTTIPQVGLGFDF